MSSRHFLPTSHPNEVLHGVHAGDRVVITIPDDAYVVRVRGHNHFAGALLTAKDLHRDDLSEECVRVVALARGQVRAVQVDLNPELNLDGPVQVDLLVPSGVELYVAAPDATPKVSVTGIPSVTLDPAPPEQTGETMGLSLTLTDSVTGPSLS